MRATVHATAGTAVLALVAATLAGGGALAGQSDPCPLTVSAVPPIPAEGGTGSFTVNTSGASCAYAVLADPGVTITSGG